MSRRLYYSNPNPLSAFFHSFSPKQQPPADAEKESYLITFPYPYLNGLLHLGHCFTISKVSIWLAILGGWFRT